MTIGSGLVSPVRSAVIPNADLTPGILLLVLLAAVMHATWNALVKTGRDRLVMQTLVILVPSIPAMIALPFLPAMEWDAVPYLLSLIHI